MFLSLNVTMINKFSEKHLLTTLQLFNTLGGEPFQGGYYD